MTGVFFSSFQSLWAMGLFLLEVMPGVFFGGGFIPPFMTSVFGSLWIQGL